MFFLSYTTYIFRFSKKSFLHAHAAPICSPKPRPSPSFTSRGGHPAHAPQLLHLLFSYNIFFRKTGGQKPLLENKLRAAKGSKKYRFTTSQYNIILEYVAACWAFARSSTCTAITGNLKCAQCSVNSQVFSIGPNAEVQDTFVRINLNISIVYCYLTGVVAALSPFLSWPSLQQEQWPSARLLWVSDSDSAIPFLKVLRNLICASWIIVALWFNLVTSFVP